jgi:enoyl-CoA hydratase/carnithine racemase
MNVDALQRIAVRHDDGLALVSLNRPQHGNAVDDRMHSELTEVFRALRRDPAVEAVVLTGAGGAFCVGGDRSPDRRFETFTGLTPIEEALEIVDGLLDLDRPVIAAVNGDALGLGAILASMADASFVARSARIGDQHVRGGVTAGNGSTAIWPLLIGVNRAKRLLMGAELLSAQEAAEIGLVSEVVEDGDAVARATEVAREWAALPAYALRTTKRALNAHLKLAVQQVMPLALALEEQSLAARQRQS